MPDALLGRKSAPIRSSIKASNFTKVLSRKQILKLTFSGYNNSKQPSAEFHAITQFHSANSITSDTSRHFWARTFNSFFTIDSNRGELNDSELFFTSSSSQIKNSCSCSRSANEMNENNAKASPDENVKHSRTNSLTETENSRSYYIIMRQYWWLLLYVRDTWCNMIFLYAAPH